jgi:hypothetical protein
MTIIAVVVVHFRLMSYLQPIDVNEGENLSSSRKLFASLSITVLQPKEEKMN